MNIEEVWQKALDNTEITRPRVRPLSSSENTEIDYIFLARCQAEAGHTLVKTGKVLVERPSIVLAHNLPQFYGFDFDKDLSLSQDSVINFFLVRGVKFPTLKYNNQTQKQKLLSDDIDKVKAKFSNKLQRSEDVHTGLITGLQDTWQFSVLIFVCCMIAKSLDSDIRKTFERFLDKDYPSQYGLP